MRRKTFFIWLGLVCIMAIGLSSCQSLFGTQAPSGEDLVAEQLAQTFIAQTLDAAPGTASEPENGPVPSPTPVLPSLTPTLSPSLTITLTPTLTAPVVHVDVDTNCRKGPGEPYDYLGGLLVGEEATIVGRSADDDYWIIENPDAPGECWIWGFYATVENPTDQLPVYTPPPTPTPVMDWSGTWITSHGVPSMMHENFTVILNQDGDTVTGSFDIGGGNMVTLQGTLSADGSTLTGLWFDSANSGPFSWQMINANQFIGNRNDRFYEWCGYRNGAGFPSPCMAP